MQPSLNASPSPTERPHVAGYVDAWINLNEPGLTAGWGQGNTGRVLEAFDRQREVLLAGTSPADMVAEMDAVGVSHALLNALPTIVDRGGFEADCAAAAAVAAQFPGRFTPAPLLPFAMGQVSRDAVSTAAAYGARAVRVMPALVGQAPSERTYYPTYERCQELGITITLNVGFPGPMASVRTQHPRHLDDVCLDFPDLAVVATHVGYPWQSELIALVRRHPNLYLMTSAWPPSRYPDEIVDAIRDPMNSKIMFASDSPLVSLSKSFDQLARLDLQPAASDRFLRTNAVAAFGLDPDPALLPEGPKS